MADPTFRSSTTQDLSGPSSITLTAPSGVASTDVVIALIQAVSGTGSNSPATWSAPSGWTALSGSPFSATLTNIKINTHLWWALGTVSFANAFTKSGGAGSQFVGVVCEAWQNVNNSTPINVVGASLSTSNGSTTDSVASVTTTVDRCLELIAAADANDGSFSATGFTNDENAHVNQSASILRASAVTTPAGATGAVTVTSSASATSQSIAAIAFALQPATVTDTLAWLFRGWTWEEIEEELAINY